MAGARELRKHWLTAVYKKLSYRWRMHGAMLGSRSAVNNITMQPVNVMLFLYMAGIHVSGLPRCTEMGAVKWWSDVVDIVCSVRESTELLAKFDQVSK